MDFWKLEIWKMTISFENNNASQIRPFRKNRKIINFGFIFECEKRMKLDLQNVFQQMFSLETVLLQGVDHFQELSSRNFNGTHEFGYLLCSIV